MSERVTEHVPTLLSVRLSVNAQLNPGDKSPLETGVSYIISFANLNAK